MSNPEPAPAATILLLRENPRLQVLMEDAGLTRGGFYNHFHGKEELLAAAVSSFLMGRGAQWRADAGIDPNNPSTDTAAQMLAGYLSPDHLEDLDGQCPMIALPSDVARGGADVQAAYQQLLEGMVSVFARSLKDRGAPMSALPWFSPRYQSAGW